MTSPFQSRWSLGDIDDIEQTIYMLNRPLSEDSIDADNFGWNSPIKYHRLASTPGKNAKPLLQLPIPSKKSPFPRNDTKSYSQDQSRFTPTSLDSLLKSAENHFDGAGQENINFNFREDIPIRKPSIQQNLSANLNNNSFFARSSQYLNESHLSTVDYEEFLANAKKQLEFELARERNDAVVKLKQILSEGAKSHIEQKRRDVINRLVGQTDAILQKAQYDILTETKDLFCSAQQHYLPPPPSVCTTSQYQEPNQKIKFRDILKRIKVAEQEKIKQRVQQSVQQVASQLVREEALVNERRQAEEIISRSVNMYSSNLDAFSASRGKLSQLANCSPNDYLQHQITMQKRLQEELKQLKDASKTP